MYSARLNFKIVSSLFLMASTALNHTHANSGALEQIDLEGVTVLEENELTGIYEQFMEREINEKDVKEMENLLSSVYMKKGFPFVKVYSETSPNGDAINFRVVEGYLKEIYWQAEDSEPDYIIRQMIDKYKNNEAFNLKDFQDNLIIINSMNTRKISAILDKYKDENGNEVEGAFSITLVEDLLKMGTVSIAFDNNASKQLERNQLTTSVKFNDLISKNERLNLAFTKSLLSNDMNAFSGSYEKMINMYGTTVDYSFNAGAQYPIGLLSELDFINKTNSNSFGVTHPFYKTLTEGMYGNINFAMKNVDTKMLGSKLYSDKIRTLSLGVYGDKMDSYNGKNTYSAVFIRGLDMFGASEANSSLSSNTSAKQEFSKLKLGLSRNQFLPYDFSFFTRLKGQVSGDSLLLSEKFTMGGAECGRGYNPSEFSGDAGICSIAEIRQTYKTSIDNLIFQPFVHFDTGQVHDVIRTSGVKSKATASSYGGGTKFTLPMNFSGVVSSSKGVNRKNYAGTKAKRPKMTFMLGYDLDF
ncbi:MAG: hypothetical protein BGO27_05385 [Alphaproteobacteria bacterium 33-17]|nr:MAG: hypothetical protein BGO27_05385 [Alphaproteobacteria bacterium 33-17]